MNSMRILSKGSDAVFFDVTTLMNNNGRITGITRVEMCVAHEMLARSDVSFIAWHQKARKFFIPREKIINFSDGPTYKDQDLEEIDFVDVLPSGTRILIQGNAWLQNGAYVDDMELLVNKSGADLTLLVHDILPTSQSQYFSPEQTKRFEQCLDRMVGIAARFLVDSEATAKELRTYLLKHRGRAPSIVVIRLGDGLQGRSATGAPQPGKFPEAVRAALNGGRFVLSVGSLSPHKNRRLLYDIWARLYEGLGNDTPMLLIAGGTAGAGAEGEQLAERLKRDTRTRSHVHIVHGLDDDTLDLLYRRCLFTVFPSLCEGWGLPVAESLMNGKICIASSTSSMKEIAPECTDLLDPLDIIAWVEKALLYSSDAKARSARESFIRRNYRATPWSDTVDQLIEGSKGVSCPRPAHQAYVGQILDLTNPKLAAKLGEPGKSLFEGDSWGVWTSTEATLVFDVVKTSLDACKFVFQAAFLGRAGVVRVFSADEEIAVWRYDRPRIGHQVIEIPGASLSMSVSLRFVVEGEGGARFGVAKLALLQADWPAKKRDDLIGKLATPTYARGQPIALADLKSALVSGWHGLEKERVWSDAGPATLLMPLSNPLTEDGVLRLRLSALVNQSVCVLVNGVEIGFCNIGPKAQYCELPLRGDLLGSLLWLELRPSIAWKPSALLWSNDTRSLGVSLLAVELISATDVLRPGPNPSRAKRQRRLPSRWSRPTAASSVNRIFEFTSDGNGREALHQGWHEVEAGHVWSVGSGSLRIARPKAIKPQLRITLASCLPQIVEMRVNGKFSARWPVSTGELKTFEADVSENISPDDEVVTIELIAAAAVPAVMSGTPDGRALGVALGRLWFEDANTQSSLMLKRSRLRAHKVLRALFRRYLSAILQNRKSVC